jgi:TPR repeat protein
MMALALTVVLFTPGAAWGDAFSDAVSAYERGDYATALPVFRMLAKRGDAHSQNNLGLLYDNGYGVPQDRREAAKWYRLAADQGVAQAQCNLGLLYDNGTGVLQDDREAVRWYRRAVAQGHAIAMQNLGAMHSSGEGVPQDYVRAHMWSNLAAAAGAGDNAVQNRDGLARRMTPAQIAEAQRLARECLASNYQRCGEPGERPTAPAR